MFWFLDDLKPRKKNWKNCSSVPNEEIVPRLWCVMSACQILLVDEEKRSGFPGIHVNLNSLKYMSETPTDATKYFIFHL